MQDTALIYEQEHYYWAHLLTKALQNCMKHIIITITGNSNKRLDIQAQAIIKIARETGAVKAGPIPLKGKRIVHIYNINRKTLDKLMCIKHDKKLNYDVDDGSV